MYTLKGRVRNLICVRCSKPFMGGNRALRCTECKFIVIREIQRKSTRQYRERHPEVAVEERNRIREMRKVDPTYGYKSRITLKRTYPEKYKRKVWLQHIKQEYGVTEDQYSALFNSQGGVCKICKLPSHHKLSIDHDHDTQEIRGLLCKRCNFLVGFIGKTPDLVHGAFSYLTESKTGLIAKGYCVARHSGKVSI